MNFSLFNIFKSNLYNLAMKVSMEVSPSIISSDLSNLRDQIRQCDRVGVSSYHIDVMDGHFVNNITIGPDFVSAVRRSTDVRLEGHLMIERPDRYYREFIKSGIDNIICHVETPISVGSFLHQLRNEGIEHGIAINPETPIEKIEPFLEGISTILVMSVHPGFSGQAFIPAVLEKITRAKSMIRENGYGIKIEVDGGIDDKTGVLAAKAGADILVSASYIFGGNIMERIGKLKEIQ